MKTKRVNRDEVRENRLTIPMAKAEKEAIQKMADKSGLTMTAWVRMVLIREINRK